VAKLELMSVSREPTPAAALERSHPRAPSVASHPQPLLPRVIPTAVWEDHLLPLLTGKDAARLACSCEALRRVVRKHLKDLGEVPLTKLRAALTIFPRARSLTLYHGLTLPWGLAERRALLKWLCAGGHGGALTTVGARGEEAVWSTIHEALRRGALPLLKSVVANLKYSNHRASFTPPFARGFLGRMHELNLMIECTRQSEAQRAALGLVRQLPALTKLELELSLHRDGSGSDGADPPVQWPPFIPSSLKALRIKTEGLRHFNGYYLSLLRALPHMIVASGARLNRLEIPIEGFFGRRDDGLAHVAKALHCCSATLEDFRPSSLGLYFKKSRIGLPGDRDDRDEVERSRTQWANVLAGVSSCRELEVLVLPRVDIEPLFPLGTAFHRLTHLQMFVVGGERERPPDAGVVGLWELMASGGLPALAKLKIRLRGTWGGGEQLRSRVAPAFEAVAGTLTHLYIGSEVRAWSDEGGVWYEWGVALGQLRRLKALTLDLDDDGRAYHTLAQGLAASGGDHPVLLLSRVNVAWYVTTNADLVASLLFPSVRVFC
jgi:hypothetical protein